MNLKKTLQLSVLLPLLTLMTPIKALATPHFTLSPTSGNQTVGQNFTVTMGIDSDTEKVVGVDIKTSFDASKLEVVSIEKGNIPDLGEDLTYMFSYAPGQAIIHNDSGSFEVTLTPINQSVLKGPVVKHELLRVTFKPKAVGTAVFNYTCTTGSVVETNIISQAGADVVDCAANQSGSYVIAAGTGGDTTTPTVTATPTRARSSSLPQTGGVEDTVMLLIMGISSIGAAAYLKFV